MPPFVGPARLLRLRRSAQVIAAAAAASTTWDPSKTRATFTLSGDNLTCTFTSGNGGATMSIVGATTGKYYWETKVTNGGWFVGIGNASTDFNNDGLQIGLDANRSVGYASNAKVFINSAEVVDYSPAGDFAVNDWVGIALDLDNSKIWFRVNGGDWNNDVIGNQNPATNTGGVSIAAIVGSTIYAAASPAIGNGDAVVVNFGATSFNASAPSGFSNLG